MTLKLRLASLFALVSLWMPVTASAMPTLDSDAGTYVDPLTDVVGLFSLSDAELSDAGTVVLDGTGPAGTIVTKDITPSALSGWGHLFVKGTSSITAEVFANGAWSNLALEPLAADGYTHRASLAVAGAHKPIRVRLTFTANGPLEPNIDALKVTWSPRTNIQVAAQSPASTLCSGVAGTWRFPLSVSNVSATGTVVWTELPVGTLSPNFGQDSRLRFVAATHGGQVNTTGAPLVVSGVSVPPGAVYWNLGTIRYGSSFPLALTAMIPNGTLDGTSYAFTATAHAGNAGAAVTATSGVTLASAAPALRFEKTLTGVYRIGDEFRAELGSQIGYRLTVTNDYSPTCRATARNLVVWDPFTVTTSPGGLFPYATTPTFLSPLLTTGTGTTAYGAGPSQTGVALPANSAYALIASLAPGESRSFEISVPLDDATALDNERLTNVAWLDSGYLPHASLRQANATFRFGIDYTPHGAFAKGENIRGSGAISASANDNAWLNVGYGEYFKYLLSASNLGASVLDTTTLFDKLPTADVEFVDAWVPAGATLYYHAGGVTNPENSPPDYDFATGTLTLGASQWSTTPTTPVTWVAVAIPRLGSSIVATHNTNAPLSVTAEIGVRVKQASGACDSKTIRNPGFFHTAYYRDGSNTRIAWDNPGVVNAELTQVVVRVPSFSTAWASVNPTERSGSGPLDYHVSFTNSLPGAANLTDTATGVVVRVEMPTTSIGGVMRPLDLVDIVSGGGGVIDDSGLPDFFEVAYPDVPPGGQVILQVKADAPRGVVDGGTAMLRAQIRYDDVTPGACPVAPNNTQATATFRVDPYLQVDKRVDFAVAGRNSTLTHTLRLVNTGEGAALDTVVFDALPRNATFVSADIPAFGQQIWFSAADVPTMPEGVREAGNFTKDFVLTSGLFVLGEEVGGVITSPVANPRWIAILADDNSLVPPQLPAFGTPREIVFRSLVPANAALDSLIVNEANVAARGLLPAVSNLVQTLISDDPALAITGTCVDVVASGESLTLTYTFTNNSTNEDTTASASFHLPVGLVPTGLLLTNNGIDTPATVPNDPAHAVSTSGNTLTWSITDFLGGPLALGASVTMALTVQVEDLNSGSPLPINVTGAATNGAGLVQVGAQCIARVENPDLRVIKLASQDQAVSGDTIQYTLVVHNLGRRGVDNAILRESLPAYLSIVPNSVSISPAGWTIGAPSPTGETDPINGGNIYEWSLGENNAIDGPTSAPGEFPGLTGPVYVRFRALVSEAPAGTTLNNCAEVVVGPENDGDTLIDGANNNRSCVPVLVPLPDPKVVKNGPLTVLDGVSFDYTLTISNLTRQAATDVVLYERIPDTFGSGSTSLKFVGVDAPAGATVYYSSAAWAEMSALPPLDPNAPLGWTTDRETLAGPVGWVAFYLPDLAGLAVTDARIQLESTHPVTAAALPAGSVFTNCAHITMSGADARSDNNESCVTTQIEGLNIAITKTCEPSGFVPGGRPGDLATFTITVENRGTTAAFGIEVTDILPSWFALASVEPAFASASSGNGGSANFAKTTLDPLLDDVPWTREGHTFYLGSRDLSSPLHYRLVGLFPGSRTTLTFAGQIDIDAAAGLLATNAASIYSARVNDGDPAEKPSVLFDNSSSCSFTVQRPDPMVEKTAFLGSPLAEAGQSITYTIGFDNLGLANADNVVIQDELPDGVTFIMGSLGEVPAGRTLEYLGPEGWGYQPTTGDAEPDPNVRGWRLVFDSFPAPLEGNFAQKTALEFQQSSPEGAVWDNDLQAYVAAPGFANPTVGSPGIATDGSQVLEWLAMFARGTETGLPAPTIEVLDANTGDVLIADAMLDEGGGRALSDIDATLHPLIQLRALFEPLAGGLVERYGETTYLDAPYSTPMNGEVWNVHGNTMAAGIAYVPSAGGDDGGGDGGPTGPLVVWEKDGLTWGEVDLQDPVIKQVANILHLDDDIIVASGYGEQNNSSLVVVWEDDGNGVWQSQHLDTNGPPYIDLDYSKYPAVELIGDAADICNGASPCLVQPLIGSDELTYLSTLWLWVRRPAGWELVALENETFANNYGCEIQMNPLGYILVDCLSFPYTVMRADPATGTWVTLELPTAGLLSSNQLFAAFLSETSADIFAVNAAGGNPYTSQLVHYSEDTLDPDIWNIAILATGAAYPDYVMNLTDGGPMGRFVVFMDDGVTKAPTVWGPDGLGGYTSSPLPNNAPTAYFSHLAIGANGTIVGTREPFVGAQPTQRSRVVWVPTGPGLGDYVEYIAPDHFQQYVVESAVSDSGFGYQADPGHYGSYVPLEAYVPGPTGVSTYYNVAPLSNAYSTLRDADADILGGGLDADGGYPPAYVPSIWSTTEVTGLVMNHEVLPTPGIIKGRILAGTPEGCLIGEVDTDLGETRTFSWTEQVDGTWTPTELTELNGFTDLKFVVATPDHRIFGTGFDGLNKVALEFECFTGSSTGSWAANLLPMDGFTTSNIVGMKNGLLIGTVQGGLTGSNETHGINAMWAADNNANTYFLYREEFDGNLPYEGVDAQGLLPWYEHGLVYGNGQDSAVSTYQAFVWEVGANPGVDNFAMTALPEPDGYLVQKTVVVDFDGNNRLLGYFNDDLGVYTVIWRRAGPGQPWTIDTDDILANRHAVAFLGIGANAPIIVGDGGAGTYHAVDDDLDNEVLLPWALDPNLDPRDPFNTPEWVRKAYDFELGPGGPGPIKMVLNRGFGALGADFTDIVGFVPPNKILVTDKANGQGLGVLIADLGGTSGTFNYFGYDFFDPYVLTNITSNHVGPAGADGSFTVWGQSSSGSDFVAYAFVPDATHATGYRAIAMPYGAREVEDEQLNGLIHDEWAAYYTTAPAGTPLGNGCWTFAERTYVSQYDIYDGYEPPYTFTQNTLTSGLETSNLRLWGCPLDVAEPTEALSSWGVTYRSNERPSVSFQVMVDDVCQHTIENTATVSTSTPQLSTDNDSSTVTTPVANADVVVTLTTPKSVIPVVGDREFPLELRIENKGPHHASNVEGTVVLPPGVILVAGETFHNVNDLPAGDSYVANLTGRIGETAGLTYTFRAEIESSTIDCTTDNDRASLNLLSGSYPDIRVTKTGPSTVQLGVPFTWDVAWDNIGNTQSGIFTVTDTLPAGLGTTTASSGVVAGQTVTWADQDLAPGAGFTATLTSVVNDCALVGQTLSNTIAAPLTGDANPDNNQASHTTLVLGPAAAVTVDLVQSQATVMTGATVFYTVHFRSSGTAIATGALIEVSTPEPLAGSVDFGGSWAAGTLTVALPDLAPGETGSFTFPVSIDNPTTVTAQAVPGPSGNVCDSATSSVTTTTAGNALSIFKTSNHNTACPGEVVTWTILVSNPTATDHLNTTVNDLVPAGATYVPGSISGPGATVLPDGSLRWTLGNVAAGTHRVLSFQTIVPAITGALFANTATVTSSANESTSTASSNTAALRIDCETALVATSRLELSCEDPARLTVVLTYENRSALPIDNVVLEDFYDHLGPTAIDPALGIDTGESIRHELGTLAAGASGVRLHSMTLGVTAANDGQILTTRTTLTGDTTSGLPIQTSNQAGVPVRFCDDGDPCTTNVCTEEGCDYLPIPNCGGCLEDTECDDNNDCTDDVCNAGQCENDNDDTNVCDGGDLCQTWSCQAGTCTGESIECDDGFDCTADSCNAATGECDYIDDQTTCSQYSNECVSAVCDTNSPTADPLTGCVLTPDNTLCTAEAGNTCITSWCDVTTGCVYDPNTEPCSDGDDCTMDDVCGNGACQPGDELECDDGFACTTDYCAAGMCQYDPNPEFCGDNECTTSVCDPMNPNADTLGCSTTTDDTLCSMYAGNECVTATCDAEFGCNYDNNTNTCDDGDDCTLGDTCMDGQCEATPLDCDDGATCTFDTCQFGSCVHNAEPGACIGNACTTSVCDPEGPGADPMTGCIATTDDTLCDDLNECTDDTCSATEGCNFEYNTNPCDDGDACTLGDTCFGGLCQDNTPIVCDDFATCTSDACVAGECVFTEVAGVCVASECASASCDPSDPMSDGSTGCVLTVLADACDDNNTCTIDTCDSATGACIHTPDVGMACDDGIACTHTNTCDEAGQCGPGVPDDTLCGGLGTDPCRAGVCDPDAAEANTDGCVVTNTPAGTVIQAGISCGEEACGIGTGDMVCDGEGNQVSTCDPAYQGVSDIGDDQCVDTQLVVYALITDPQSGALRGSVRCVSTSGTITCETEGTDPQTGLPLLKVYEELLCPGTPPVFP